MWQKATSFYNLLKVYTMDLLTNIHKWGGVTLLLVMFVMFNSEARANDICIDDSTTILVFVGGCQYSVIVCYSCAPYGPTQMFKIFGYSKIDTSCVSNISESEVLTTLSTEIADNLDIYFGGILNCNLTYPPCGSGNFSEWIVYEFKCWRKYNNNGSIEYVPNCGGGDVLCVTQYYYCYNGSDYEKTINYQEISGKLSLCPVPVGDVIDPPPGEYSDCFYVDTVCD
jgi:hypothetical protein